MCTEFIFATRAVDVWDVALDGSASLVGTCAAVMSTRERERADQYHFDRDRNRFIVRRGVLRLLLAGYTGISPEQLVFGATAHGKPFLNMPAGSAGRIRFSVTHSAGKALCAFAGDVRLGVDLERVRDDVNFESLVRRFFAPAEQTGFLALPDHERADAFFAMWTRKEALLKAEGIGLSVGLDAFEVPATPAALACAVLVDTPRWSHRHWTLIDLAAAPGYRAALAADQPVEQLQRHTWCW